MAMNSASDALPADPRPRQNGDSPRSTRTPKRFVPSPSSRLVTLKVAAAELGMSVWTLRDLIGGGQLRAVQPPGMRRIWIDRRDLDKAIEAWKS